MPKRHLEETNEDRWRRKMKKYEHKLEGKRRRRHIIYSEDEDNVQTQEHLKDDVDLWVDSSLPMEEAPEDELPKNDVAAASNPGADPSPTSVPVSLEDDNFDPSLLQALGDSEADVVEYGEDLQAELATRFQKILLSGLKKDSKDEILKKYLYPKNVPLVKGPTLNPEIGAMLVDTCKLRDKRLHAKQDQLGKALSALGKAMTNLMKKNSDIPDVIRTLNDTGKLLADSHYNETDTRRSVIIPLIDKSLMDSFKDRKRDNLLFGENLGDLVKNSRGIKKTSQLIQATGSNVHLNGRGSSSRRSRNQRGAGNQTYNRAGGSRVMTSYQFPTTSHRRTPTPPPPPGARRQPYSYAQRYPSSNRKM